jgi:hypothetical protein
MRSRGVAWWGFAFVVLLLVSAGMATVPGRDDTVSAVRQFYSDNEGVVVVSQILGLLAAATFVPFVLRLQRQLRTGVSPRPLVALLGVGISAAAAVTAVPPLLLCWTADSGSNGQVSALAQASDLTDVLLFAAIACWAVAVLVSASMVALRVIAALVMASCAARAILILAGSDALTVVAPITFLVLVATLCLVALRTSSGVRVPQQ